MRERLIKSRMGKLEDPIRAKKMAQYMKNQFDFYGIRAKDRRTTYKDIISKDKKDEVIDWDLLFISAKDKYREMSYFVSDYLSGLEDLLKYEDLEHLRELLLIDPWWDTVDMISRQVGTVVNLDPKGKDQMINWSTDDSIWIRRTSIIHQLKLKDETDTELLKRTILNNIGTDEFFINKAIGWALREYSKSNPGWVRDFINTYRDGLSKLSIREGSKYI